MNTLIMQVEWAQPLHFFLQQRLLLAQLFGASGAIKVKSYSGLAKMGLAAPS